MQVFEFMGNHPILFALLFVIIGFLIWDTLGTQILGIHSIRPYQAISMVNHQEAVILDVREEHELAHGRILNAVHVPLTLLVKNQVHSLERYRDKPIIVSCAQGNRSVRSCMILKKNGFTKIHNLKGGIVAWEEANLPLTK
jgi:rhodanese-related sulfurtransferase